tara:strand:- start:494 stop:679 length:186 start_codon:yes stop_codon:yes gene_type:complete
MLAIAWFWNERQNLVGFNESFSQKLGNFQPNPTRPWLSRPASKKSKRAQLLAQATNQEEKT